MLTSKEDFKRFELLERFAENASKETDVITIIEILESDPSLMVRHEAAARLLKLAYYKPHLIVNLTQRISGTLVKAALGDKSIVVRHESIEALGYLGGEDVIPVLSELTRDQNLDIRDSATVALDLLKFRLHENVPASKIADRIIDGSSKQ